MSVDTNPYGPGPGQSQADDTDSVINTIADRIITDCKRTPLDLIDEA